MTSRRQLLAGFVCCLPFPASAEAINIALPRGTVILEVEGAVHAPNSGDKALLDLEMLDALPQTTFSTTTIWTEGMTSFSGPTLASVLELVKAEPGSVTASAANDYSIMLSTGTYDQDYPVLATRKNGLPLSLRDFGPIWLVYPYDSSEDYRTNLIYSQSVWQLTHLIIGKKS